MKKILMTLRITLLMKKEKGDSFFVIDLVMLVQMGKFIVLPL